MPASLNTLKSTQITLKYNQFTFAGLESFGDNSIFKLYAPQADIPLYKNGSLLWVSAGGTLSYNTYQWFKDDVLVSTKTGDSTYNILSPGVYSVTVTNSKAFQLTLHSVIPTNLQDSMALVDLYNSTNGQGWVNATNWNTTASLATWYGVLNRAGRVVNLELSANNLTGNIPPTLSNLSGLGILDLSSNRLSGSIPASIVNLINLRILQLGGNQLTGNIPVALGSMPNLGTLSLEDNLLGGSIPPQVVNSATLNDIRLSSNQLTGTIPPLTISTSPLTWLDARSNQLSGSIPASIGRLSKLGALELSNNQLTGVIPDSICNLVKLQRLELNNNLLTGKIPDSMGSLINLFSILLNNNHLSGSIPSFSKIKTISALNIGSNAFTFSGMETLPHAGSALVYSPQASIPLNKSGNMLTVSAGGSLANDTFRLYKDGVLLTTQKGDSTFTVLTPGAYYVTVTNAIATQLTLSSNIDSSAFRFATIADGNWNDPAVWFGGVVPGPTAQVTITNSVVVTTNTTCYALKIVPPLGRLIVNTGFNLTITH